VHEVVQKLIVFCIAGYGFWFIFRVTNKTIRDLRGQER
jgi:hypothetical protein